MEIKTMQMVLHEYDRFCPCKPLKMSWLTQKHKYKSIEWAQIHAPFINERYILSNEKKFS